MNLRAADTASVPVDVRGVLCGVTAYAATLYFTSNAWLLLTLAILAFDARRYPVSWLTLLPLAFAVGAIANILSNVHAFDLNRHSSSLAVAMIPLVALLAPRMPRTAWVTFLVLTILEICVGIAEFALGRVALFASQAAAANQELSLDSSLVYDRRVFGLSSNSSVLAEKIFICSMLCGLGIAPRKWLPHCAAALIIGLYITFNRTTIVVATAYVAMLAWPWIRSSPRNFFVACSAVAMASAVVAANIEEILLQLFRGGEGLSYSELSRFYFWEVGAQKLLADPLIGNGSLTWRVEDLITGQFQHAHNSFVMLFVTHGAPLAFTMCLYVLLRARRSIAPELIAIAMYSMMQYFVFWNLSVPDLFMFWLLGSALVGSAGRNSSRGDVAPTSRTVRQIDSGGAISPARPQGMP